MRKDLATSHILIRVCGILFVVIGSFLMLFALYLIPHLYFNWAYPVPEFIFHLKVWHQTHQTLPLLSSNTWLLLCYFLAAVLCFLIATVCNRWLEQQNKIATSVSSDLEHTRQQKYTYFSTFIFQLTLILLAVITVFTILLEIL